MDGDDDYLKVPEIIDVEILADRCLFHAESGKYWTFSETSARIWALLDQHRSKRAICRALAAEYDADPAVLDRDIAAFLEFLVESRLLRRAVPG